MRRKKRWQIYPDRGELINEISARHGLPLLVARLLLNRGLSAPEDILAFLDPALERLHPPFRLADLDKAAARLAKAVRQREPVAVYGDYDADGLTATALLRQFFQELGLKCVTYIPNRLTEGYGLKTASLETLRSQGVTLVISVDCGITALPEVRKARKQGLDIIITDHHIPREELPQAEAAREAAANAERELKGVWNAIHVQPKYKHENLWSPEEFEVYRWLVAGQILAVQEALFAKP